MAYLPAPPAKSKPASADISLDLKTTHAAQLRRLGYDIRQSDNGPTIALGGAHRLVAVTVGCKPVLGKGVSTADRIVYGKMLGTGRGVLQMSPDQVADASIEELLVLVNDVNNEARFHAEIAGRLANEAARRLLTPLRAKGYLTFDDGDRRFTLVGRMPDGVVIANTSQVERVVEHSSVRVAANGKLMWADALFSFPVTPDRLPTVSVELLRRLGVYVMTVDDLIEVEADLAADLEGGGNGAPAHVGLDAERLNYLREVARK